jgi:RNA polymerase sigma-70 factor (ECF subfamily)
LAERGEKEMSDEMLVSYARSGDATAFVELTKRHANKVFQAAYRITRNRQDAEDALQDSFLRAFVHVKDFQEKSSFATWLTRIAINSALMILRKKRGGSEIPLDGSDGQNGNFDAWEPRSYLDDPESSYFRREKRRLLRRAIDQLPPVSRDVVQLRQTRDCSVKEIAQSLGITVSAVKSRLSRANSALRASLLQTGSEPPL